jgi:tRNA(Leu) C34 or U34 (ribose-2'-O)-methylase TrmL
MRGFSAIALDNIKDRWNLGGALRAAGCFDVRAVLVKGNRMGKFTADTMKAYKHTPCFEVQDILANLPYGCIPVVVELTDRSRDLMNFCHPERAMYIFGPEDGNVGKDILNNVSCVVQIPTKRCLNLAATINIVLYDRLLKQSMK